MTETDDRSKPTEPANDIPEENKFAIVFFASGVVDTGDSQEAAQ